MTLHEWLRLIAGLVVLSSLVLGAMAHPWNYLAVFATINLIQSAFTGWCPMMALLRRLGVPD